MLYQQTKRPNTETRTNGALRARLLGGTSLTGRCLAAILVAAIPADKVTADGPILDSVVAGDVSITRPTELDTTIDQRSDKAIINWTDFSIGENDTVTFNQPTANSLVLNRVTGDYSSEILGQMTANGNVFLINPNGILFGANAKVDVGGLVATTSDISDDDFLAGRYDFKAAGYGGSIINAGTITARDSGLAAFVAPHVENNGIITAHFGRVELVSGSQFTVDLYGDRLIQLAADDRTSALLANAGTIMSDGGTVVMQASTARGLVDSVVNMTGVIEARSVAEREGRIILSGTRIEVSGTVDASQGGESGDGGEIVMIASERLAFSGTADASAGATGGDGGFVETSGKSLNVSPDAHVDTSAPQGSYGTWSLDPETLAVVETATGDNEVEVGTITSQLENTNVELAASVSISVNADINTSSQSSATTLSLVDEDADGALTVNLNAAITLGANQTLTGDANVVNVYDAGEVQDAVHVIASGASASSQNVINVYPGSYSEGNANVTQAGARGGGQNFGLHIYPEFRPSYL